MGSEQDGAVAVSQREDLVIGLAECRREKQTCKWGRQLPTESQLSPIVYGHCRQIQIESSLQRSGIVGISLVVNAAECRVYPATAVESQIAGFDKWIEEIGVVRHVSVIFGCRCGRVFSECDLQHRFLLKQ